MTGLRRGRGRGLAFRHTRSALVMPGSTRSSVNLLLNGTGVWRTEFLRRIRAELDEDRQALVRA